MNLHDIILIKEIEPHISVAGITREKITDSVLEIEGVNYRVFAFARLNDGTTAFFASNSKTLPEKPVDVEKLLDL